MKFFALSTPALGLASVCLVLPLGCGDVTAPQQTETRETDSEVRWTSSDDPTLFGNDLVFELAALPTQGAAARAPWAANYWPTYQDSINFKWDGSQSTSPAAKYGQAFGVQDVEDAVSNYFGIESQWNRAACSEDSECRTEVGEACAKRDGHTDGYCVPTWFGICHAWAPAAILLEEPKHEVTHNNVTFKVNDIKALVTLAFNRTNTEFASLRCNASNGLGQIEFDEYGRPLQGQCIDTNPGTFHILLANYLGTRAQSFVYDRTFDDQVWNQPLRSFEVTSMTEVTADRANELVGHQAGETAYQFNVDAVKFFDVYATVNYITESSASTDGNLSAVIDRYTRADRYHYILELDDQGRIIGGEWLGSSKTRHPDFVWLPLSAAGQTVAGGKIRYDEVMQLHALSIQ